MAYRRLTKRQRKNRDRVQAWLAGEPFRENGRAKPAVPDLSIVDVVRGGKTMFGPYLVWLMAALSVWVLVLVEYQRQQAHARGVKAGYWRGHQAGSREQRRQDGRRSLVPQTAQPAKGDVGSLIVFIDGVTVHAKLAEACVYGASRKGKTTRYTVGKAKSDGR